MKKVPLGRPTMTNERMKLIRQLRTETGAGVLCCDEALRKADDDLDKARRILRVQGHEVVEAKSYRETPKGLVASYIHHNRMVGAMVEIRCETDFAAATLRQFGIDICMQIAATAPEWVDEGDVSSRRLEEEMNIISEQVFASGKTGDIAGKIIAGKLKKFKIDHCLLSQKSVKDSTVTVGDLLAQKVQETGENIVIKRFARFHVDESKL